MAFNDWNHDGKKDWQDNFIEYQIYKDVTGDKDEKPQFTSNRSNNGAMSTFGAVLATIATIIITAAIIGVIFGGDVSNLPGWLLLVIFIIVASVISALFS